MMIKTLNPMGIGIEILNVDMEGESENPTQIRLIVIPFVIVLLKGSPFVLFCMDPRVQSQLQDEHLTSFCKRCWSLSAFISLFS